MMRFVSAAALIVGFAACKAGSERNKVDTSTGGVAPPAAAPAPAPTGGARVDTAAGTLAPPASTTGRDSASRPDTTGKATSSASNQTQSGVTNAKTGKSTLGSGVKKAEPTQGQPVTSKGDTLVKRKKP
jgi:hypothetical protein